MQQINSRTPMSKYDFNKVAKQLYWNHTAYFLMHILLHTFKTPFPKYTYGGLLLYNIIKRLIYLNIENQNPVKHLR